MKVILTLTFIHCLVFSSCRLNKEDIYGEWLLQEALATDTAFSSLSGMSAALYTMFRDDSVWLSISPDGRYQLLHPGGEYIMEAIEYRLDVKNRLLILPYDKYVTDTVEIREASRDSLVLLSRGDEVLLRFSRK